MNVTPTSGTTLLSSKDFLALPQFDIDFELKAKIFNQEGDMKFEYNAFRNLRDSVTGELKDFRTPDLNFNLNNPVEIEIQRSYDNSVNLILNDDLNPPKLINSRFTLLEDDRYQIIDRKGNTDTNIYKEEVVAEVTRLYKTSEKIPYVVFQGLSEGGALKSGNYVFYFKYADADGNESDIITESGLVSCYIGKLNDPFSTRGGLANELTNKIAKMTISNLDQSYDYVNVYFTRATGDTGKEEVVEAYKILNPKIINGDSIAITITGLETTQQISVDDLNLQYSIVDAVKSQAQVQNMLFFGNVDKPTIPYTELEDLSLRIYPMIGNANNIGYLDEEYQPVELLDDLRKSEYYDAVNVYNYTGYWNKEMYRIGIVYVMKDDTLSPAFNIRGRNNLGAFTRAGNFVDDIQDYYTYTPLYDNQGHRQYINYDDDGFIKQSKYDLENAKGVLRIAYQEDFMNKDGNAGIYPLSINFNIEDDTITELKKYVKGFFFVRQKRIPTIIAQGISIGTDQISYIPSIKTQIYQNSSTSNIGYIAESFVDKSTQLVHDFTSRLLVNNNGAVTVGGFICPEAQLRSEFFSEVFTGALFNCSAAPFTPTNKYFNQDLTNSRHFYIADYTNKGASSFLYKDVKLTLIEDNQPMKYSGTKHFSTRVGIPEEAYKFSWFNTEDRGRYATNIIRGAFTGFVGVENFSEETTIVDIHIPGYDFGNMRDYFLLRAQSFHPFYAISDRYDLNLLASTVVPYANVTDGDGFTEFQAYRGDCFIGTYTTRIVRNFQDPETPINDTIIDTLSWKTNYTGYTASGGLKADDIAKINRGDVNAVKIGHWATFKICSNINLCYRSNDETHTSEYALTGVARSFYPLLSMSPSGESKIPDSQLTNVGYNTTTSSKIYIAEPNVPYIKNIFSNRLMFSEIHINDAFRNGYRVFKLDSYKDLTNAYGQITTILEWKNNLMVVFSDGVGVIPINEKMVGATGQGSNAFITSNQVIPDIVNMLSTNYGSNWKDSVVATTDFVYGVDATAKKIWRTNGSTFEVLSDFKIQKFLNDNITLKESDNKPLTALLDIRSHYNAFKQDIMFTFYDNDAQNRETIWSMCYNEKLENWITRYSWVPLRSADISNVYFSFDREAGKKLAMAGYSLKSNDEAAGIVLDSVLINSTSESLIGTLSLKGYNYYSKYLQTFTLDNSFDSSFFDIRQNGDVYELWYKGGSFNQYAFTIRVRAGLSVTDGSGTEEVQFFFDYLGILVNRANLSPDDKTNYDDAISNWFWKHGQAGIFDNQTVITPTFWYGKQEAFEFEFIAADNPQYQKIWDNLKIISNDAEPDSFYFSIIGDSYSIDRTPRTWTSTNTWYSSTIAPKLISTYQKGLTLNEFGRRQGNMQYKEDLWDVEIRPFRHTKGTELKEARIRDKYIRIRVKYSGTELAVITALQTLYTQSYA